MSGENLAEYALPFVARPGDRLERLARGDVHHVDRYLDDLGDADGAIGGLALDFGRARQRVASGPVMPRL